MNLGLTGKRVLVLGSSSGLGYAIAKAYSEEGALCAILSRDFKRAEEAAKDIKNSTPFECDLEKPFAGKKIVDEVVAKLGTIDILITNAGGPPAKNFMELENEDWDISYRGLWMSAIDSVKRAAEIMIPKKWGRIILTTSTSSKEMIPSLVLSNAYRSGLMGVMKSAAYELGPHNITVNAILPGFTKTKRLMHLNVDVAAVEKTIPLGRMGNPEELAALAVFLGSEKASYINGQAIACDGGRSKCI